MDSQPKLQFDVAYPEQLSRWKIFLKWFLAIPHFFVLYFVYLAFAVTNWLAFFLILILGRYPRGLWDFGMMVMRWQARVTAYLYLMRDEYPPFGDGDYPVLFQLDYPERLSRWKIFVKWLLAIPHYIVLAFLGIAVGIVLIVAWFAILITGRYPRSLFDFSVGVMRWASRVSVYVLYFTDAYPPFSLDPEDPAPTLDLSAGYGTPAPSSF